MNESLENCRESIRRLQNSELDQDELEVLFAPLVSALATEIGVDLGFDVQEQSGMGFARCIAYETKSQLGAINIRLLALITIQNDAVEAIVLLYSGRHRLGRKCARAGEFCCFQFCLRTLNWQFRGWYGDEFDEYDHFDDLLLD